MAAIRRRHSAWGVVAWGVVVTLSLAAAQSEIDWTTAFGGQVGTDHVGRIANGDAAFAGAWRDVQGKSLLHIAAEFAEGPAAIAFLLELGVDPNRLDRFGRTALQVAIMANPVADVALALVAHPATDVTKGLIASNEPLALAIGMGRNGLATALSERIVADASATETSRVQAADWLARSAASEQESRDAEEDARRAEALARAEGASRVSRIDAYAEEFGQRYPLHGNLGDHLVAAVADHNPAYLVGVMRSLARDWSPLLRVNGRPLASHVAQTATSADVVRVLASEGLPLVVDNDGDVEAPVIVMALRARRPLAIIEAWIDAGALGVAPGVAGAAAETAMSLPAPLDVARAVFDGVAELPGNEVLVARAREWLAFENLVVAARGQSDLLHQLLAGGRTDQVFALIARGIEATQLDGERRTLLHVAAGIGDVESVTALLPHFRNVDALDRGGQTALGTAILGGVDATVVTALLSAGANPYLPFRSGTQAVDIRPDLSSIRPDVAEVLRTVVEDVWSLHDAAERGTVDRIPQLLYAGIAVDARDAIGRTALMIGVGRGNLPVVRLLLNRGANPRATDAQGSSVVEYGRRAASESGSANARRSVAVIEEAILDIQMAESSWRGTWVGTTSLPTGTFPFEMWIVQEFRDGELVLFAGAGSVWLGGGPVNVDVQGFRQIDGTRGQLTMSTRLTRVTVEVEAVGSSTLIGVDVAPTVRQAFVLQRR